MFNTENNITELKTAKHIDIYYVDHIIYMTYYIHHRSINKWTALRERSLGYDIE